MVFDSGGDLPIPERESGIPLRFGSFNHARKLSDETIRLYCGVLEANPGSELALKSISFLEEAEKQRIRDRFNNAGLEANRLILLDWVEGGLNHLKRYGAIDIALDPIPYGGATTTAEALWMGVPVVAMAGIGMVGRLAASLLVFGNQKQWLARSEDEYIKIASELASKGPRYQERRLKLREELLESPLADGKRLSRELEAIYLRMREAIKSD
jgi:predicted O-linked N-acetylglucosamine transferase (SPINDLY family)